MEINYCVYMHVTPSGKRYIGQTCCEPNRRWQNGYGYVSQVFFRAIKKYGWENIEHIILADNLTASEADRIEQQYIEEYQTTDHSKGYNIAEGGHGGKPLSEEHKKKISAANSGEKNGQYGRRYSEEERKYMSEHSVWRGRKHTEETRRKLSEYCKAHPEKYSHSGENHPMYGKHHSDEVRLKMSEAAKRKFANGYKSPICKRIMQFTLDGVYINTYESIKDASNQIGSNGISNISAVCAGKRKTAGGYVWRYADGN